MKALKLPSIIRIHHPDVGDLHLRFQCVEEADGSRKPHLRVLGKSCVIDHKEQLAGYDTELKGGEHIFLGGKHLLFALRPNDYSKNIAETKKEEERAEAPSPVRAKGAKSSSSISTASKETSRRKAPSTTETLMVEDEGRSMDGSQADYSVNELDTTVGISVDRTSPNQSLLSSSALFSIKEEDAKSNTSSLKPTTHDANPKKGVSKPAKPAIQKPPTTQPVSNVATRHLQPNHKPNGASSKPEPPKEESKSNRSTEISKPVKTPTPQKNPTTIKRDTTDTRAPGSTLTPHSTTSLEVPPTHSRPTQKSDTSKTNPFDTNGRTSTQLDTLQSTMTPSRPKPSLNTASSKPPKDDDDDEESYLSWIDPTPKSTLVKSFPSTPSKELKHSDSNGEMNKSTTTSGDVKSGEIKKHHAAEEEQSRPNRRKPDSPEKAISFHKLGPTSGKTVVTTMDVDKRPEISELAAAAISKKTQKDEEDEKVRDVLLASLDDCQDEKSGDEDIREVDSSGPAAEPINVAQETPPAKVTSPPSKRFPGMTTKDLEAAAYFMRKGGAISEKRTRRSRDYTDQSPPKSKKTPTKSIPRSPPAKSRLSLEKTNDGEKGQLVGFTSSKPAPTLVGRSADVAVSKETKPASTPKPKQTKTLEHNDKATDVSTPISSKKTPGPSTATSSIPRPSTTPSSTPSKRTLGTPSSSNGSDHAQKTGNSKKRARSDDESSQGTPATKKSKRQEAEPDPNDPFGFNLSPSSVNRK